MTEQSKLAKQRNEIARLQQALEQCASEKRQIVLELRTARRNALDQVIAAIRKDERAGDISAGAAQLAVDTIRALIDQTELEARG